MNNKKLLKYMLITYGVFLILGVFVKLFESFTGGTLSIGYIATFIVLFHIVPLIIGHLSQLTWKQYLMGSTGLVLFSLAMHLLLGRWLAVSLMRKGYGSMEFELGRWIFSLVGTNPSTQMATTLCSQDLPRSLDNCIMSSLGGVPAVISSIVLLSIVIIVGSKISIRTGN